MNLLEYIKGRKQGKEAHRIEREAINDPFLAEALEGYEGVEGDHSEAIRQMQQKVDESVQRKQSRIFLRIGIAASILLLAGAGWYFLRQESMPPPMLAEHTAPLPEENISESREQTEVLAMAKQAEKSESRDISESEYALPESGSEAREPKTVQDEVLILDVMADDVMVEEMVEEDIGKVVDTEEMAWKEEKKKEWPATDKKYDPPPYELTLPATVPKAAHIIQGKVTDKSGEALAGVSITTRDRQTGTVTGTDGRFRLPVGDTTTLVANFIGYQTQEVKTDSAPVLIALQEAPHQLEEIVVTGYGARQKARATAADNTAQDKETGATPEPVNGKREYKKYMDENLIRPLDEKCSDVKGKVTVRFHVNKEGRPYQPEIIKSLCETMDEEAKRLILEGPDWTYGEGEVYYTIRF